MKLIKIFLPIFMIFTLVFGIAKPVINTSENISDKVLRFHILANSDSTADQNLKLKVKNHILDYASDIFIGKTLDENIKIANDNIALITGLANECIKGNGFDYTSKVTVTKEYFNTRVYDDFTLPAGEYNSLKIEIGEGNGHNWWCIIYPSVCLSACTESMSDYLSDEEMELVTNTYTPKFKLIEIYQKLKYKITRN